MDWGDRIFMIALAVIWFLSVLYVTREKKPDGVWVVYDYNVGAYLIAAFEDEIEAHRYQSKCGHGYVKFLPYGFDFHYIDKVEETS